MSATRGSSLHETAPAALLPLLRELGDLKRITSAGRPGSIATRLNRRAWSALQRGGDPRVVASAITAYALVATRMGDIDHAVLHGAGVPAETAASVMQAALAQFADVLPAALRPELTAALAQPDPDDMTSLPPFVEQLEGQPRAGVTCPGKPRIVLQPAESHAEHCLIVAVYGVLLAPTYRANPETVFLAGLAHHLHNGGLPDSGFTGEELLGDHLAPVMQHFTAAALATLDPSLRREVERARAILPDDTTPEGRAFHAADVIDRVLEIDQHLAAARLTMDAVLGDMALVHDGPVKPFHDRILAEMGLQ